MLYICIDKLMFNLNFMIMEEKVVYEVNPHGEKSERKVVVKVKLLRENSKLPLIATRNSVGFDVYASEINQLSENSYEVNTGIAVEVERGYYVELYARSSLAIFKNWVLTNGVGIIDPDYRGELKMVFSATPIGINEAGELVYPEFPYKVGDRCGQLVLRKAYYPDFEVVDELSVTERGSGGYGSTGRE